MNKVILMGRVTKDTELKVSGETTIARNALAVDRPSSGGERSADFINLVAFGKVAEIMEKYCFKGTKILIEGRIQTGSYTNKDGQKIYTTDVVVTSIEFCESKNAASNRSANNSDEPDVGEPDVGEPDVGEEKLPWS